MKVCRGGGTGGYTLLAGASEISDDEGEARILDMEGLLVGELIFGRDWVESLRIDCI